MIAGWELYADPLCSALLRGLCSQENVFWVPDTLRQSVGEDFGDCLHMGEPPQGAGPSPRMKWVGGWGEPNIRKQAP